MSSTLQNLVAILGILIIGAVGYFLYIQNADLATDTVSATANQASREAAEFLGRLNEVRSIELDSSIFTEPAFQSLVRFETPVTPVSVGRDNPFASPN